MRKTAAIVTAVLVFLILFAVIGGEVYVRGLGPRARTRVIQALSDRFDADVELKSLTIGIVPRPSVSGEGLFIRHRGWPAKHPLIAIARFSAHASLGDLLAQHDHIDLVRLEGLQIHVPPQGASAYADKRQPASEEAGQDMTLLRIAIHEIIADDSLLEVEPKVEGKDPLRFPIAKLTLWSVGAGQPFSFRAELQNAKPPGFIQTSGRFGPWQKDDPRASAVSGSYAFSHADLSVFKGIKGTLASGGSYNGILQRIEVSGDTDSPDFALQGGGAPVRLRTTFHAIVDGSDGETVLDPVRATFLHSTFICRGGVIKVDGDPQKTVDLYAVTEKARMEDILQLLLGGNRPLLEGAVDFKSKIVIPPGNRNVLDKLQLDGTFKLRAAQFTSPKVEQRLDTLSDRARGITKSEEKDQPPITVASNFLGKFRLSEGVADFSTLVFEVPGAQIRLAGDYHLGGQQVNLKGVFRMDATLSQTQGGLKHWLLRPFDPMFRKDGAGFQIPLTVSGTRAQPEVSAFALHHKFTMK